MRLSPKSVFFGLVAFGLPIAVTVGWTLATPAHRPATVALSGTGTAGGAGGIGSAPERPRTAEPATTRDYDARPALPAGTSAAVPAAPSGSSRPLPGTTLATPSPEVSFSPLPSLILPPVPTPTEITVTPSPSSSPSAGTAPSEAPAADS